MANSEYKVKTTQKYTKYNMPGIPGLPGINNTPGFPGMPGIRINSNYKTNPYLPNLPALPDHYWGYKYEAIKKPEEKTPTNFVNYNDPKQINSVADIVLGSFNPHMNHSKLFGEDISKIPVLNIIPNTLEYMYKYTLKPALQGDWKAGLYNLVPVNLGETTGILGNIVKSVTVGGPEGDSFGQGLLKATFGDSSGRRNYDYNTGVFWKDFLFEVISDPLNWVSLGGKSGIATGVRSFLNAADGQLDDISRLLSKAIVDNVDDIVYAQADDAVKTVFKNVKEGLITNADDFALELQKHIKTSSGKLVSMDKLSQFIETGLREGITKQNILPLGLGSRYGRSTLLNNMLGTPTNSLSKNGNNVSVKVIKTIQKKLAKEYGKDTAAEFLEMATRNGKTIREGLIEATQHLENVALYKMSKNVLVNVGSKAIKTERITSRALFEAGLFTTGVYPLYKAFKASPWAKAFAARVLRHSEQVNNLKPTSFLESGSTEHINQSVQREMGLMHMATGAEDLDPQIMSYVTSEVLAQNLKIIKEVMVNNDYRAIEKRRMIIESFSKIDENIHFENMEEIIAYIKAVSEQFKQTPSGELLQETGFEDYIKEYELVNESLESGIRADSASLMLESKKQNIQKAQQITQTLSLIESKGLGIKSVLDAAYNTFVGELLDVDLLERLIAERNYPKIELYLEYIDKQLAPFKHNSDIAGILDNVKELRDLYKRDPWAAPGNKESEWKYNKFVHRASIRSRILSEETYIVLPKDFLLPLYALVDTMKYMQRTNKKLQLDDIDSELKGALHDMFITEENGLKMFNKTLYSTFNNMGYFKEDGIEKFKQSNVYKEALETLRTAKQLTEFIDSANKYSIELNSAPSSRVIKNAMKRPDILDEARNMTEKQYTIFQYGKKDIKKYLKDLLKKQKVFSHSGLIQIKNTLEVLKDAGISDKRVHDYNEHIFEEAFQHIRYYARLLGALSNATKTVEYEVLYKKVFQQQQTVLRDLAKIDAIIGPKSVFDPEYAGLDIKDLSGVGIEAAVRKAYSEKAFTYGDAIRDLEQEIDELNRTGGQAKDIKVRLERIKKLKEQCNYDLKRTIYIEKTPQVVSKINQKLRTEYQRLKELENNIDSIDFYYIEEMLLHLRDDTDYYMLHFDKAFKQQILNQTPALKKLFNDEKFGALMNNILNKDNKICKEFYKYYSEDTLRFLVAMKTLSSGIANKNALVNRLKAWEKSLRPKDKPAYGNITSSILTTLEKKRTARAYQVRENIFDFMDEFIRQTQGYLHSNSPVLSKYNLDYLLSKAGITEADIQKELTKLGVEDSARHHGLYDVIAELLVKEKDIGTEYYGVVLDIEATGLNDARGVSHGQVLEIAAIKRNSTTKEIEIIVNSKVQLPKDEIKARYMLNPEVLSETTGQTEQEFIDFYSVKNGEEPITEQQVLLKFFHHFEELAEGTEVLTFNGAEYDILYLKNRFRMTGLENRLMPFSKARKINNKLFKNEQEYRHLKFEEMCDRLIFTDYYQTLNKDRYVFSSKVVNDLTNIMIEYLDAQLGLERYTKILGRHARLVEDVQSDLLNELRNTIDFTEFERAQAEDSTWLDKHEGLLNELALANAQTELSLEQEAEIIDTIRNKKLQDQILRKNVDHQLGKHALEIYGEVIDTLRNFKQFGDYWRSRPFDSSMFDQNHPYYRQEKLLEMMSAIADTIEAFDPHTALSIRNSIIKAKAGDASNLFHNFTQATTVGISSPIFGYKRISRHIKDVLNVPDGVYGPALSKADDLRISILSKFDSIYNVDLVVPYEQQMKDMIKDIVKAGVYRESTYARYDSENIPFTYATLEAIWGGILARSSMGEVTRYQALITVSKLKNKYPELIKLIESGQVHIKPNMSGSTKYISYSLPAYAKLEQSIEYQKTKANQTCLKNILEQVKLTYDTATFNLKAPMHIETLGTHIIKLNQMALDSYTKDQQVTAQSKEINNINRLTTDILFAWETNQFLNLDVNRIRDAIIDTGKHHTIVVSVPSKQYFNNTVKFAEFMLKKKELTELGVTWHWDEEQQLLTLGLSDELIDQIQINKNTHTRQTRVNLDGTIQWGAKYTLNKELVYPVTFPEIPETELRKILRYDARSDSGKAYIDELIKARKMAVEYNPELSGRVGITNSIDDYIAAIENPRIPHFGKKNTDILEDHLSYFNTSFVGERDRIQSLIGPISRSYLSIFTSVGEKMCRHSHNYMEMGKYIMTGGISLENDWLKQATKQEIIEGLKAHPEFVLVYLTDCKHAKGFYEIRKVNDYTEATIKEARRLNATIVTYDTYEWAAKNINQYSYHNKAVELWSKYLTVQKRFWLTNAMTMFNNAYDSALKNYVAMGSIPSVMKSYVDASVLHNKYVSDLRNIAKMDPMGYIRLENVFKYFDTMKTELSLEEFQELYEFIENSGINTTNARIDGLFGLCMKPNAHIETISRLALYLDSLNAGYGNAESNFRNSKTHFNYETQTYATFIAKMIFPFYTFFMNSIAWFLDTIENNPGFFRNFLNVYRPIWDLDSIEQDELEGNTSLQYQIVFGRIPLSKLFGYEDKEIIKTIDTKYGKKQIKVTNTATLNLLPSIFDMFGFLSNPYHSIVEKTAPQIQLLANTATHFIADAYGNNASGEVADYGQTLSIYNSYLGNTSLQTIAKDPSQLMDFVPGLGQFRQRILNSKVYERTENPFLAALPGVIGATSRWGEFTEPLTFEKRNASRLQNTSSSSGYSGRSYTKRYYPKRFYPKKSYAPKLFAAKPGVNQGVVYRYTGDNYLKAFYTGYPTRTYTSGKRPYSKYDTFLYNIQHPNQSHRSIARNKSGNMQTIPQYLYSYGGRNKRGGSKILSWMRMDTSMKVKNTLKRLSTP